MRRISTILAATVAVVAVSSNAPPAAAQTGLGRLFACEQSGQKQEGGAAVGAVLGALVGSQISKNERTLGAVAGAALGAAAGSYIGCRMQSTDQARAQAATKAALDEGRSQSWSNPQTGASGRVDVLAASYGPPIRGDRFRFEPGVQSYATYEAAGGEYYAPNTVNLRGGPSASSPIVGKLAPGERFTALGGVAGGTWLLVDRYGAAAGYVSANVVRGAGIVPTSNCRTIQTTTSVRGYGAQTERFNACRDGRGEWQLTAV
jgi:surface antigen